MHKKLFIPGPTEVMEDVLNVQAKPMIGHRSKEFSELLTSVVEKLKRVLATKNEVYIFTSSGTGVMEAAIRNCVKNKVLSLVCGAFSKRWAQIAKACNKEVATVEVDWGKAIKPEMVADALKKDHYDAVTLVHNETSTGVRNPIEGIAEVIKEYPDTFLLVDTVSSLMGDKIEIDKLGIDVCLASVQKCFALPPGMAVGVISERALKRSEEVTDKGYYFDFLVFKKYWEERRQTPTTPAISLIQALDYQLDRIEQEGVENRYQRHREMAEIVRGWAKKFFAMFSEEGYHSVTVSAITNTRGISVADLNKELGKQGYMISNGYGKLKEKTFRIAHMGDLTKEDINDLLGRINAILKLEG
ncbi:aminotransferase [candidate division WOR-3 bacterium]|uniref:Aminotransferase n=1 Tax=candidate division WOR-3 bacterium TaxID=2052148 RepID=A0A660SF99_UNCW3|nr:MAG: aminotransferase [candidate division WOR-3 bacterium]